MIWQISAVNNVNESQILFLLDSDLGPQYNYSGTGIWGDYKTFDNCLMGRFVESKKEIAELKQKFTDLSYICLQNEKTVQKTEIREEYKVELHQTYNVQVPIDQQIFVNEYDKTTGCLKI
ncbi:hypothetical protein [Enterococcus bulliens]